MLAKDYKDSSSDLQNWGMFNHQTAIIIASHFGFIETDGKANYIIHNLPSEAIFIVATVQTRDLGYLCQIKTVASSSRGIFYWSICQ